MKLNEKRVEQPAFWTTYGHGYGRPQECRVVYIHPKNRFYTVEFQSALTGETYRQCYYFEDRRGTASEDETDIADDRSWEQQGRHGEKARHPSGRHIKRPKGEALYHF